MYFLNFDHLQDRDMRKIPKNKQQKRNIWNKSSDVMNDIQNGAMEKTNRYYMSTRHDRRTEKKRANDSVAV